MSAYKKFGNRGDGEDSARIRCLVALLILIFILNATLGFNLELDRTENIDNSSANWAIADYRNGVDNEFLVPKQSSQIRLLYLSNSHAFTGGQITSHLQGFLNTLTPGGFEVLNMAEPGIFAPDMLQRGMRALDYDIDVAILGLNYINFSDRMRLDLQAHSARSFFNQGIFNRLPAGFWLRNYDLGLYSTALTQRISDLYRSRNELRNQWEQPLTNSLKALSKDNRPVFFLEMENDERWRFPDGYDNNLFQWNLYASGRNGHLKDMESLLGIYAKHEIPVIAVNMPIDFDKSVYEADQADIELYADQLSTLSRYTVDFQNYQGNFPAEFSTYDALHPTWHGARLHAFDLLLKLNTNGYLGEVTDQELLEIFTSSDQALSLDYLSALNGNYPPHPSPFSFKRFDPSEPDNARELLRHLAAIQPGSGLHSFMLDRLARVTRFWMEEDFPATTASADDNTTWGQAVDYEVNNARQRMTYFQNMLSVMEQQRLEEFVIPDTAGMNPVASELISSAGHDLQREIFQLASGDYVVTFSSLEGVVFAKGYQQTDGSSFYRIDILGNNTFIQVSAPNNFLVPGWLVNDTPDYRWGI